MVCYSIYCFVSLQFTMWSLSALMNTINFGKKFLLFNWLYSDAWLRLWFSKHCRCFELLHTFLFCVCLSLVTRPWLPSMRTLNTPVSWWAPGTHGTESRIRQVRHQAPCLNVVLIVTSHMCICSWKSFDWLTVHLIVSSNWNINILFKREIIN